MNWSIHTERSQGRPPWTAYAYRAVAQGKTEKAAITRLKALIEKYPNLEPQTCPRCAGGSNGFAPITGTAPCVQCAFPGPDIRKPPFIVYLIGPGRGKYDALNDSVCNVEHEDLETAEACAQGFRDKGWLARVVPFSQGNRP